jgi:hypothetical protein
MSKRKGRNKRSYVADPERRAYLAAVRTLRDQITRSRAQELKEAGLIKRVLLRFQIEREVKRRSRDLEASGRP